MPYFHTVSISASHLNIPSYGIALPNQLLNSTNLFQGVPQGLQLNGLFLGSSLGSSVIGSPLEFDIFSGGYLRCSSENVPSILEKRCHLFE